MHPDWPAPMAGLIDRLLGFIAGSDPGDAAFDALALALFDLQYRHDEAYRRFCQRRGCTPARLVSWRDIPPVPIAAFKDATLSCVPPEACERIFTTSGTTRGDVKGRNHHPTMTVWDASMRRAFEHGFRGGARRLPMATLFPSQEQLPHSSLARYLSLAVAHHGTQGSRAWVDAERGLDLEGLLRWLHAGAAGGEPVALLGASFSLVHLLDALDARRLAFRLPPGSLLLDTGGYKGRSRELPLDAFYDRLSAALGVPRGLCINMYGMTELSSQFYDAGNAVVPSVKRGPRWVRTRVVDPATGREMPPGERGLLAHCDLANFNSATAILTEDVGIAVDGGFQLLGRAEGAEAKGCSLAVQDFLEATRG